MRSPSRLRWPRIICAALALTLIGGIAARASTVLAVVGDWGSSGAGATSVATMVSTSAWQTDYVVTVGDNNYGSVAIGSSDWENFAGARYGHFMQRRAGTVNPYPNQTSAFQRFFPTVGNHDRGFDGTISGYIDYFHSDPGSATGRLPAGMHTAAESYYDVELPIEGGSGSIHLFAMDSDSYLNSPQSRPDQIDWLRDGLKNSTATWKLVVLHHAPFSSGLHGSNPLTQLPFQQWGAHAVLAGHDHVYERLRVTDAAQNEMLYFVNGVGGATVYSFGSRAPGSELRYNDSVGAMRISLSDQQASFEFLAVPFGEDGANGGTVIDSFTLDQSALPTPPLLSADHNDDGFVDALDLSTWQSALGVNGLADADGDGDSDGTDFLAWQVQLSGSQYYGSLAATVPEPLAVEYAGLAFGCMMLARKRHEAADLGSS